MTQYERELRALAASPPGTTEPIEAIRARASARRRRDRRLVAAGLTAGLLIAVIVPVALHGGDDQDAVVVTSGGRVPRQIWALEADPLGDVVDTDLVAIPTDRAARRNVWAEGVGTKGSALTVHGTSAFVSKLLPVPLECPTPTFGSRITRVDLVSSESEVVANGSNPLVSPDGTQLAYSPADCATGGRLTVRDLATGNERTWFADETDGSGAQVSTSALAWDRDSRHLIVHISRVQMVYRRGLAGEYRRLDTNAVGSIADAPKLKVVKPRDGPFDLLALGTTGRWAAVVTSNDADHPLRIVEYDMRTGSIGRTLVSDIPVHGQATNPSFFVDLLSSDPSGRNLLFSGFPLGGLYRSSGPATKPILVSPGTYAAAWAEPGAEPGAEPVSPFRDEITDRTWHVDGPEGHSYTVERFHLPQSGDEVGFRLIYEGRSLHAIITKSGCVGNDGGGARLAPVLGGTRMIGTLPRGATGADLAMPDGTTLHVDAIGGAKVPIPFYIATVPVMPTNIVPTGIPTHAPCV